MDKNTIIGLVLIFLIIVGFSVLNRPSKEELAKRQRTLDSIAQLENKRQADLLAFQKRQAAQEDSARLANADSTTLQWTVNGAPDTLLLENDFLKLHLVTAGGRIAKAQLKGFKTYQGDSLCLFQHPDDTFGFLFLVGAAEFNTSTLPFLPLRNASVQKALQAGDTAQLTLRFTASPTAYIDYTYTLPYHDHQVKLSVQFHQMDQLITSQQGYIDMGWRMFSPQQERGIKREQDYSTIAYSTANGDYEELNRREGYDSANVNTKVRWVAFKEQFFMTALSVSDGFMQGNFVMNAANQGGYVRQFDAKLMLPFEGGANDRYALDFYLCPNHYETLKDYGFGMEKVIPLGWSLVSWVNKYFVIPVFNWLNKRINSYGLIILILTILIKLIVFPLTYKSYVSSAKMRVLKPMVDQIGSKFPRKEDAMKKQQAIMELYKRGGVNPMGGCLPMLIQFPILVAMFYFFPASIELRQQSFLWADDLSTYDSIFQLPFSIPFYGDHVSLFTLLMCVSMFLTSLMNLKQQGNSSANSMPGMKFMMLYMMPIMMLFFLNNYSSGLSYYYLLANLITIGQTFLVQRLFDEKKLLEKINSTPAKKPKKSRFMQRLEQMQKEQERRKRR